MAINTKFVAILLLLSLGNLGGLAEQSASHASAPLTTKQARVLENTATTPQEHLSLSAYYREEARKFEHKVRYHEEMAEMYRQSPLPFDGKMAVVRRDVEYGLNRLERRMASPESTSYFKAAKGMKGSLERWHIEQQQIGLQLGIQY